MRRILVAAAWIMAAAVLFWTLGPVQDRPQFGHPQLERFAAFLVLGIVWASAYSRRRLWIGTGLVLAAIGLEAAQGFVHGRDPGAVDAIAKAGGALCGVLTAALVSAAVRSSTAGVS